MARRLWQMFQLKKPFDEDFSETPGWLVGYVSEFFFFFALVEST